MVLNELDAVGVQSTDQLLLLFPEVPDALCVTALLLFTSLVVLSVIKKL